MKTYLLAFAFTLLAAGCCFSHAPTERDQPDAGFDAGPDTGPDADAVPDAPLGPHYWTIEARPAGLNVVASEVVEGQTAFVRVTTALTSSCESPGPVDSVPASGRRAIFVTARIWVEHGVGCDLAEGSAVRDVAFAGLGAGTWSIVDTVSGLAVTLDVSPPPPPITCTAPEPAGTACLVDCDCQIGLVCVPYTGYAFPPACGAPCDDDLDCWEWQTCQPNGWAARGCGDRPADQCQTAIDCPAGMDCYMAPSIGANFCNWAVPLNGSTRHACADETDCAAGLDCVQHADGPRACEVRCTTNAMRCPGGHLCAEPAGIESPEHWVCEWVGD